VLSLGGLVGPMVVLLWPRS